MATVAVVTATAALGAATVAVAATARAAKAVVARAAVGSAVAAPEVAGKAAGGGGEGRPVLARVVVVASEVGPERGGAAVTAPAGSVAGAVAAGAAGAGEAGGAAPREAAGGSVGEKGRAARAARAAGAAAIWVAAERGRGFEARSPGSRCQHCRRRTRSSARHRRTPDPGRTGKSRCTRSPPAEVAWAVRVATGAPVVEMAAGASIRWWGRVVGAEAATVWEDAVAERERASGAAAAAEDSRRARRSR
jgi:hypothetical protein